MGTPKPPFPWSITKYYLSCKRDCCPCQNSKRCGLSLYPPQYIGFGIKLLHIKERNDIFPNSSEEVRTFLAFHGELFRCQVVNHTRSPNKLENTKGTRTSINILTKWVNKIWSTHPSEYFSTSSLYRWCKTCLPGITELCWK